MTEQPNERVVLRLQRENMRWSVNLSDLAIYARGERAFTMRVPYLSGDFGNTDAYAFEGFLLVFQERPPLHSVGNEGVQTLRAYELGGCLRTDHLPFLVNYMRQIASSTEHYRIGTEPKLVAGGTQHI